jgi:hypothetical protein
MFKKEGEEDGEDVADEKDGKPKDRAALLREKAERIKKKYEIGTPAYEKLIQDMYRKTVRFYLAEGFAPESLFSYVWDEPPPAIFDTVVRMAQLMKEAMPQIPTYVTANFSMSEVKGREAIDIITPHMGHVYSPAAPVDSLGHVLRQPETALGRYHEKARQVCFYQAHTDYLQGEHAVDYPLGLFWRAWQMDVAGIGLFAILHVRGELVQFPTKKYEAWREGVEDLLAMRDLEKEIRRARDAKADEKLIREAEESLRVHSQEVMGYQWWWADSERRYRLIRAARAAFADIHLRLLEKR